MTENKTKPTDQSPEDFLDAIENDIRRADGVSLLSMMQRITGEPAVMWGPSIIGFGSYAYRYESGREGRAMLTGFSPRKAHLVLYIMPGFSDYEGLLSRLGKHKTGKSCLYVKRLSDIDETVLDELITLSVSHMRQYDKATAG